MISVNNSEPQLAVFTNLRPYTKYTVRVKCQASMEDGGTSYWSNSSVAHQMTLEQGQDCTLHESAKQLFTIDEINMEFHWFEATII